MVKRKILPVVDGNVGHPHVVVVEVETVDVNVVLGFPAKELVHPALWEAISNISFYFIISRTI